MHDIEREGNDSENKDLGMERRKKHMKMTSLSHLSQSLLTVSIGLTSGGWIAGGTDVVACLDP